MRLFISYARVDKPYCIQIVNTLDVHDIWYDQRLYAGQQWWKEILRRIDWCEGFIYLLSEDSVSSQYCLRELEIAIEHNRQIIPILIQEGVAIPQQISEIQYIDLTRGLDANSVQNVLNSIYIAEQRHSQHKTIPVKTESFTVEQPPTTNSSQIVFRAAEAMENGHFDQAVFLLKQAKTNGYNSRFINVDVLLKEAETALEKILIHKEAEREYRQILDLLSFKSTRTHACKAFIAFQKTFPKYDPEGIASLCDENFDIPHENMADDPEQMSVVDENPTFSTTNTFIHHKFKMPLLDFVRVDEGIIRIDDTRHNSPTGSHNTEIIPAFQMSRFPTTNLQYQTFINDSDGYCNLAWWGYSEAASKWRKENPDPRPPIFKGQDRPREMVTWYEAQAYANWLSNKLDMPITIPTVAQWQRAVQGNDDRLFPWGNTYDFTRCNTRESKFKMTTQVTRFTEGHSPYDIFDLAGNIWEWCLDPSETKPKEENTSITKHKVVGGSFVSPLERSQVNWHYNLDPRTLYSSIGFRVVTPLV